MPRYSEREWMAMLLAPLWVFQAVAKADGEVAEAEWNVLLRTLHDSTNLENELSREVMADLGSELETAWRDHKEDEFGIGPGLRAVVEILERKEDRETASGFKTDLLTLAFKTAQASGGRQQEIGQEGKRAIEHISNLLGIDEAVSSAFWARFQAAS